MPREARDQVGLKSAAVRLLDAISGMHQRNRTVVSSYAGELSVVETSILVELLSRSAVTAKNIAIDFQCTAVRISRILARLEKLSLLKRIASPDDKRTQYLHISARGIKASEQFQRDGQTTFGAAFLRVPEEVREKFTQLFQRFCLGLRAPSPCRLPSDPPLMGEIRQITRALGFLSPTIFGIRGVEPVVWHILRLIDREQIVARDLSHLLGVPANTMTGILDRLEKKKLIERRNSRRDKRERELTLSAEGLAFLRKAEAQACALMSRGLDGFSAEEATLFAECWERYSLYTSPVDAIVVGDDFVLRELQRESELALARSFILKARVEQGLLHNLPDSLCCRSHTVYGVFLKNSLVAVFDLAGDLLVHGVADVSPNLIPLEVIKQVIAKITDLQAKTGKNNFEKIVGQYSPIIEQIWGR